MDFQEDNGPQQRTIKTGLRGALLDELNEHLIHEAVDAGSRTQHHTFAIAALYAARLVQHMNKFRSDQVASGTDPKDIDKACDDELSKLMAKPTKSGEPVAVSPYFAKRQIFNQTALDQITAFAWARESANAPEFMTQVAAEYWSGPKMKDVVMIKSDETTAAGKAANRLFNKHIRGQLRSTTQTAISNCLEFSTPQHMASFMRQTHQVSAKENKILCARLGTSFQAKCRSARLILIKRAERATAKARVALKDCDENDRVKLQTDLEDKINAMNNQYKIKEPPTEPGFVNETIAKEFHIPKARHVHRRVKKKMKKLLPLQDIIDLEQRFVPQTQNQWDQLQYRYNLLSRLPDVFKADRDPALPADPDDPDRQSSKFNLIPTNKFSRIFISFTKKSLCCLVKCNPTTEHVLQPVSAYLLTKRKAPDDAHQPVADQADWTLEDELPRVFKPHILKMLGCGKDGKYSVGASLQTDGIQVCFNMVTKEAQEIKLKKAAAAAKTRKTIKATFEEEYPELAAEQPTAKRRKTNKSSVATLKVLAANAIVEIRQQFYKNKDAAAEKRQLDKEVFDKANPEVVKKRKKDKEAETEQCKKAKAPAPGVPLWTKEGFLDLKNMPNARLIGIDPGIVNVIAVSEQDGSKYKYSLKQFYNDSGQKKTQRMQLVALKRERAQNKAFKAAEIAINLVSTKTHDPVVLLDVLQTRAQHFETMYAFYGREDQARVRFVNHIGTQSLLSKLVERISPRATRVNDYFIWGNGEFEGSNAVKRGNPSGMSGKLYREMLKQLLPGHIVFGDEFRSSILDSQRPDVVMQHPPRVGKRGLHNIDESKSRFFTTRVYSRYQSSAPGYSCTVNRDVNGATNIRQNYRYQCLNNGVMPEGFRRGIEKPKQLAPLFLYRAVMNATQFTFPDKLNPDVNIGQKHPRFDAKKQFQRWPEPLPVGTDTAENM